MPTETVRPTPLRGRIFRGSQAIAEGLLTKQNLRNPAWRPLFRDVYADSSLPTTHQIRCAGARLLLPAGASIAGRSAAALYGVVSLDADEPVEVIVPAGHRLGPVAGLRVHSAPLREDDVRDRLGLPVTTPGRTCWDLAQWQDVVEAVVTTDALLRSRLVSADGLREYALARAGERGWRKLTRVAGLADPGAESPPESRLRVRLVLAGLPRPTTQYVVSDGGQFLARVDLAWPDLAVAIEYDGVWHHNPEQLHRDRRRLNKLLGADWLVLHATAQRLHDDFDNFVAEVRAALRSRSSRSRR